MLTETGTETRKITMTTPDQVITVVNGTTITTLEQFPAVTKSYKIITIMVISIIAPTTPRINTTTIQTRIILTKKKRKVSTMPKKVEESIRTKTMMMV